MNPAKLLTQASESMLAAVQRGLVVVQASRHGAGAGILLNAEGLILTNSHVMLQADNAHVTLADGKGYTGQLLGRDPEVDLALVQIEAETPEHLHLGDSTQLRVGEVVYAVGHPWGLLGTVTGGIVSHLTTAQTRGRRGVVPVIRTDARLAPGNSGGPLVNAAGEVMGINTMIVGGDQGVAIPSAVAKDLLAQVKENGAAPYSTHRGQKREMVI